MLSRLAALLAPVRAANAYAPTLSDVVAATVPRHTAGHPHAARTAA